MTTGRHEQTLSNIAPGIWPRMQPKQWTIGTQQEVQVVSGWWCARWHSSAGTDDRIPIEREREQILSQFHIFSRVFIDCGYIYNICEYQQWYNSGIEWMCVACHCRLIRVIEIINFWFIQVLLYHILWSSRMDLDFSTIATGPSTEGMLLLRAYRAHSFPN